MSKRYSTDYEDIEDDDISTDNNENEPEDCEIIRLPNGKTKKVCKDD